LAAEQGVAQAQEQLRQVSGSYQRVTAKSFGDWRASRSENSNNDSFCLAFPSNYLAPIFVRGGRGSTQLVLVDSLSFLQYGAEKLVERLRNKSSLENVYQPETKYTGCQLWVDANNFAVNGRLDATDHWDPKPEFVSFKEDVMLFRLDEQERFCVIAKEENRPFFAKLISSLKRGSNLISHYEPTDDLEYPKWDLEIPGKGTGCPAPSPQIRT